MASAEYSSREKQFLLMLRRNSLLIVLNTLVSSGESWFLSPLDNEESNKPDNELIKLDQVKMALV
jgi:hypothetical protein